MVGLFDGGGQFLVVCIDDKHREQLCRFGLACIAADGMARARRFVETFAGAEHLPGSIIHLRFDFAGQDIAKDESRLRVGVRRRCSTGRIVHDHGDQRLAGNVGYRLFEVRRDLLADTMCRGRRRSGDGDGGESCADDGSYFHGGVLLCLLKCPSLVYKKVPRNDKNRVPRGMTKPLNLQLDRSAKTPLTEQIRKGITAAIESGALAPGARLPSWLDLAAQLGVARGTVRSAYAKLAAAQFIAASRATGTHVADRLSITVRQDATPDPGSFMEMYQELTAGPAIFQMGVPAQEAIPAKLMARIRSSAVRAELSAPAIYPDPRGELALRREVAAYLAIARGIECSPSQIIITGGFSSGLGLALRVLGLEGRKAWVENPGFPFTRRGLELARLSLAPIPVDVDGMDVDYGLSHAPDAALAVVTPGQQAPLGFTLSLARRLRLLDWAAQEGAWVIEDDYLSELQLQGRATSALASLDRAGRVIHIGSFSKTLTPALRLGFLVAPLALVTRFAE